MITISARDDFTERGKNWLIEEELSRAPDTSNAELKMQIFKALLTQTCYKHEKLNLGLT